MVLLWFAAVSTPRARSQRSLSAELSTLQQSIQLTTQSIQETADADPTLIAQREETQAQDAARRRSTRSSPRNPPG